MPPLPGRAVSPVVPDVAPDAPRPLPVGPAPPMCSVEVEPPVVSPEGLPVLGGIVPTVPLVPAPDGEVAEPLVPAPTPLVPAPVPGRFGVAVPS